MQQRPFYLTRDFGKLKKETVYLRRGSSTDFAKPDEIAQMGASKKPLISIMSSELENTIASGEFPVAHIIFKNTGEVTATDVQPTSYFALATSEGAKLLQQGKMSDIQNGIKVYDEFKSVGVLAVGQSGHFLTHKLGYENPQMKEDAISGKSVFYAWGEIFYSDVEGNKCSTKFCFYNRDVNSNVLSFCENWNEIKCR